MPRKLVFAVAILVAGWFALTVWNDDGRRIKRRLAALQRLAAKAPVETRLQGAAKASEIADFFAGGFELRAEPESFATANRQDLVRGIMSYRARTGSLVMQVSREQLFLDSGGASATHYAYVEFLNDLGDLTGAASYPVRIEWVKEGGAWMIRKLEVLRAEPAGTR